ncbi:MAG: hypothetical protein KDJ20_00750 [Hyphomicrobiales bacterium]|nr:hypothetical protein [Hyphomicrobiales bacterium]MCC2106746.1 hypothetical protein [Hyphomicrobiales bacterium]HRY01693.1 hypothetical protein [Beijerinckiaceae bacterium]
MFRLAHTEAGAEWAARSRRRPHMAKGRRDTNKLSRATADYFRHLAGLDESPIALTRQLLALEYLLIYGPQRDEALRAGITKARETAILMLASRRARSKLELACKFLVFQIPDPWQTENSCIDLLVRHSLQADINELCVASVEDLLIVQ